MSDLPPPVIRRIYELVGEATTAWNQVETLWYLIFTGLMDRTERAKVDAIFSMFQTGALQRQLIMTVAPIALKFEVSELRRRNPEHHVRRRMLREIGRLNAKTNDLAGHRNATVHTAFEDWGAAGIHAIGIHRRSRIADQPDKLRYLSELVEDITLLVYELDELRYLMIDWLRTPQEREDKKVGDASMRTLGILLPEDDLRMAKAALLAIVSQRKSPPPSS
ncbi:hypothetical protein [Sphingopyxis sp.]|uniref:hypothetical protein n=1 Tax=Sphingopyxis sp. TaxID=1908224 RepID=UPI0035B3C352